MQQPTSKPRRRKHFIPEWCDAYEFGPSDLISATEADKSIVSRWLGVKRSEPSPEYLAKLSKLFGVPSDRLYAPPPPKRPDLVYTAEDPALPEPIDPDRPLTRGGETEADIPADASAQLDVTAGMGAGGLTIVAEGIPGKKGMTFAAEHISDYWRLPTAMLSAMGGVKPADVTFVPVQGDSMLPTLTEGDVVVVDTRHRMPSPDGLYAINDAFGGIVVKRLEVVTRPGDEQQLVDVISDNAERHPRKRWSVDDLRIVGRVLRKFGVVQ